MRVAAQVGADQDPRTVVLDGTDRSRCNVYLDGTRVHDAVLVDTDEGLVRIKRPGWAGYEELHGVVRIEWMEAFGRKGPP